MILNYINFFNKMSFSRKSFKLYSTIKIESLATGYKPKNVEKGKYDILAATQINNSNDSKPKYSMILPPPNITGNLHLGHALTLTLQDVICRWKTLMGFNVVWIPGIDHAGIATQVVVEKMLFKERKLNRHELGKKMLIEEIWKWKDAKEQNIIDDLNKMGSSFDWSKKYFTLDKTQSAAVEEAFIRLFEENIIYRADSLINWSCTLESAISDIEVDNIEVIGPTFIHVPGYKEKIVFGQLTDIAYKFTNCPDKEIIISTTRPETLLGDVAVAVHPEDKRYSHLKNINCTLWHPFHEKPIPLVFDSSVNPEFGTGAVKITPAHDKVDFLIGKRHSLPLNMLVIDEQGLIKTNLKKYNGIPRFEARKFILSDLKELNLLRGIRPHLMTLPICSRSKDVIEYLARPQWFVDCKKMSKNALKAVESRDLIITPNIYEKEWKRWLSNCQDWCISRQVWWGHQIPAYECEHQGVLKWVAASSYKKAEEKALKLFGLTNEKIRVTRDQDVLDTWFSSSILPFSVFGWPNLESPNELYPLDLMETGNDILFFWVARMVMMAQQLTGKLPFKNVLLHGIICDSHGRKMSKSLGNVISPQQIINGSSLNDLHLEARKLFSSGIMATEEFNKTIASQKIEFPNGIPECGTDSLRFTLCSNNIKNRFINFDATECFANKLFLNKIWQATRYYVQVNKKSGSENMNYKAINMNDLPQIESWILSRLSYTIEKVHESIENYNFHLATSALKQFFYDNFCDVYLETTKSNTSYIQCNILGTCLSLGLVCMSPFTPFLSMELLNYVPSITINEINSKNWRNVSLENDFSKIFNICYLIRQVKSQNNISKKHNPKVHLFVKSDDLEKLVYQNIKHIKTLTLCEEVIIFSNEKIYDKTKYFVKSTAGHLCSFGITTSENFHSNIIFDINKEKLNKLEKDLEKLLVTVSNQGYIQSANENIKKKHLEKIKDLKSEIENIKKI